MKKYVQLWLCIACTLLSMMGCTVVQPLPVDSRHLSSSLSRGDRVEVVTTNGQTVQLAVDKVDEQGLHGNGQLIAYSDIRSISRRQISAGRTALVVLAVVGAGAALAGGGGGGGGSGY